MNIDFEMAQAVYASVIKEFYREEDGGYFREFAPVREMDRKSCFLWSYFAVTGMMYYAVKAGMDILPFYKKQIDGFKFYRSGPIGDGMVKYHSERGDTENAGYGPCFFDDNIWVARNYLFAYELLEESRYLEEAERIVNYIYTGWNQELGGLVWNENGLTPGGTRQELERGLSANACCIIVNARLYQLTKRQEYLDWAGKFYAFCSTVRDPDTGIYYNGVHTQIVDGKRKAGPVNRDLYGYNSGSMILADLLLYEITGEAGYLSDAHAAAEAAHHAFLRKDKKTGLYYYKDFDWFTAILVEGYHALAAYGKDGEMPYVETLDKAAAYAWDAFRSEAGLLPHDYVTGWRGGGDDYDRMLLTHGGTVEILFLLLSSGSSSNLK